MLTLPPNRISRVDTTLSLARKPLISEVVIRQSPRPRGRSMGASSPAIMARMLSWEFSTMFRCRSKLWRNQTTMVAMRMMEKARCRKSLAFSHRSWTTFFAPGIR